MSTALATATVDIRGTGRCPFSAEVAERLAELLPAAPPGRRPDLVQLSAEKPDGGGVTLTLRRADGALLARKSLDGSQHGLRPGSRDGGATCGDLAAAAALIIATWESDVHPEFKLNVPRRPPADRESDSTSDRTFNAHSDTPQPRAGGADRSSRAVPVPRQAAATVTPLTPPAFQSVLSVRPVLPVLPAPNRTAAVGIGAEVRRISAESPVGATRLRSSASAAVGGVAPARPEASPDSTPLALPPPAPVTLLAAPAARVRSPAPVSPVLDVGVAVLGALSPLDYGSSGGAHGVAGGAALAAGWTSMRGWGAHLALLATTERTISLSPGQVNWRRITVALGPQHRWQFSGGRLNLDVHADAVAALLTMRGTGFASNSSDRSVDPGVGGAVRVSVGRGRWRPWLEVSTVGWLIRHFAYESPDNGALALPRVETMLALGLSYWNAL